MILQALCEYYDRKAALGEMPPYGRESRPIPYLVVINPDGDFLRLESTAEDIDGVKTVKKFMLCHSRGRTGSKSWATANSLWDHYGYVFGFPDKLDFTNTKKASTQFHNIPFHAANVGININSIEYLLKEYGVISWSTNLIKR